MAERLPLDPIAAPPLSRTRLFGRQSERASARAALLEEGVPLLSLIGPGGVGKTRLALAIAEDLAASFADGIAWVDLTPLEDPAHVPELVATALGVASGSDELVTEALVRHLRTRQTALLLDNCEFVVGPTAELVERLLGACPALQVLATSRAPLRVRGEHEFLVDPLAIPADSSVLLESLAENDAVRLFVDRARAVRPTFALTEANAASVAALCRKLDGLPLAIELAAARVKILSPEALLAQMTDRLRLLRGGYRDLPARQQTIEATIAWSYHLLDKEAQELFRRLGVFSGGCDLDAAVAVAGGSGSSVLDRLGALCEQSLLRVVGGIEGPDRYVMLETVREFARERLDECEDATAIRDAHAAHFLAVAEAAEPRLRGPELTVTLNGLSADYPNLRAAMAWLAEREEAEMSLRLAGALFEFWRMRSAFAEGRQRLEEALSLSGAVRNAAWAKAQTALGYMTVNCFDTPRARGFLEDALTVWEGLGDPRGIASAELELASLDLEANHLEQARARGERTLATYREFQDEFGCFLALYILGIISIKGGDYCRARAELEESLALSATLGPVCSRPTTRVLGWLAMAEGDEQRAARVWEERLATNRELGNEFALASAYDDLGWLALRQGNQRRAVGHFAEELALGAKLNEAWDMGRGLIGLGMVNAASDQAARAAWLFGAAETAAGGINVLDEDVLSPIREPYERAVAATGTALGEDEFAAAWREGRAIPTRQAVARALADLEAPETPAVNATVMKPATDIRLTDRESEVLRLLVRRLTDREIADALFISRRTANHHVGRIFEKLGVANRREAGAVAVRLGLV